MEPRARVSVWPGRRRVPGIVAPYSWEARGAECLPRDVLRRSSSATGPCGRYHGAPMSVPSNRVRHHGSTPPRKQCTPGASTGVRGVYRATRPIPGRIFGAAAVHHGEIRAPGEIRCQSLMPLVRSAYRSGYSPDNRNNKLGFRVARAQRVRWTLCRTEPIAHRVPAPRRRANTRFRPSGAGSEPRRLRAAFPFRFQAGGGGLAGFAGSVYIQVAFPR